VYLSHPVRRLRADPTPEDAVTLVVTAESADHVGSLAAAIEGAGGTVDERLEFGAMRVEIATSRIDDLCGLDGIESIETAAVLGVEGDAGEDVGLDSKD